MNPSDPGGNLPPTSPSIEQRAEVASLAAKVASLPTKPGPKHGKLWWILHGFFWVGTLTLLAVALLRIFYHDGSLYLTWINAFTRYVYLPVYVALFWAVWMRRWILAGVALVVVSCHVAWMYPNFVRDQRFDLPAAAAANANDSPTLRIFFANIYAWNMSMASILQEIADSNADVVVLAECSRASRQSFEQSPQMQPYVNANGSTKLRRGEVVIYSKLPIKADRQDYAAGRILQTADIELGSQTLRLIGLHSPRPMPPPDYDYVGYWQRVVPLLTSQQGPVVIVGDFNATEHSLVYKQLQDDGLRSAHDDRGRGYATTWPNGEWMVPPIRIDQAFISPDVECVAIQEGLGKGSDHRPLIVDIRLRPAAKVPSP